MPTPPLASTACLMASAQALPERREVVAGGGRRGGQAQPRAVEVARALQRALGVVGQREDAVGVLAERLAGRCEPNAAADAVEEPHAVLALELADLQTHGGDGHPPAPRPPPEKGPPRPPPQPPPPPQTHPYGAQP